MPAVVTHFTEKHFVFIRWALALALGDIGGRAAVGEVEEWYRCG